jgi:hypothetical protein
MPWTVYFLPPPLSILLINPQTLPPLHALKWSGLPRTHLRVLMCAVHARMGGKGEELRE